MSLEVSKIWIYFIKNISYISIKFKYTFQSYCFSSKYSKWSIKRQLEFIINKHQILMKSIYLKMKLHLIFMKICWKLIKHFYNKILCLIFIQLHILHAYIKIISCCKICNLQTPHEFVRISRTSNSNMKRTKKTDAWHYGVAMRYDARIFYSPTEKNDFSELICLFSQLRTSTLPPSSQTKAVCLSHRQQSQP